MPDAGKVYRFHHVKEPCFQFCTARIGLPRTPWELCGSVTGEAAADGGKEFFLHRITTFQYDGTYVLFQYISQNENLQ
jgi:hypothetical protein